MSSSWSLPFVIPSHTVDPKTLRLNLTPTVFMGKRIDVVEFLQGLGVLWCQGVAVRGMSGSLYLPEVNPPTSPVTSPVDTVEFVDEALSNAGTPEPKVTLQSASPGPCSCPSRRAASDILKRDSAVTRQSPPMPPRPPPTAAGCFHTSVFLFALQMGFSSERAGPIGPPLSLTSH